jgi:DNA helicase-2/ATP-dependent DNA helicase PcrA
VVHLADAEQYPHRLADDVEEERRLFHVAITRASQHATIVTGPRPSPFVDELTNEPSERRVVSSHRPEPVVAAKRAAGPTSDDLVASLDDDGRRRFEALKGLRNELRDGKPAYVVFDNKTLVAIARTLPTSRSELSRIPGIGPAKLDQYGEAVLALLTTL